ncbi:gp018 [Rhodococcus phage ReqiPoco6]|uniref:Gp018 n=1 Tax=Rhodococcus phage ReqiPoco6 TaxID=691964 RepID=D4P7N6_9CAUD|nr:gp018 [Rhodococcus phage ReqiPoco6]ADD81016.1 gp018 [Rhodococcus phage ReqiPoco6]
METLDAEDFLAHYGVKGMKWGQTRSKSDLVKARAAGRREFGSNLKDRYTKTGKYGQTKIKKTKAVGTVADIMLTGGMYTGVQIARSGGFTRGQSAVIGMITGPVGATVASEIRVRTVTSRDAR